MIWVDWAIVIVIAAAAASGLMRGFFRTACALIGIVGGLVLAAWNYKRVAEIFLPLVRVEEIADAIAFLLIALAVMIIAGIIGSLLARVLEWMGLGCLDRIAGGVLGIVQGAALVTLAILVIVAFFPGEKWLRNSHLAREFLGACHVTAQVSPQELAEKVHRGLRLLEQESPVWMHPGTASSPLVLDKHARQI